ncbi:hypothetical protein K438DRAFT_1805882, partial [Mycena galopus ATCC 62051]
MQPILHPRPWQEMIFVLGHQDRQTADPFSRLPIAPKIYPDRSKDGFGDRPSRLCENEFARQMEHCR